MFFPIILGTAREGRQSEKVANFMLEEVARSGIETALVDVRDYRIAATDKTQTLPQAQKLAPLIARADGVIVVAPEYNHGYPGELKMLLDMLYGQYAHKPLGICGVSIGGLGGARMVEQLRLVSIELHMIPIREALYFGMVQSLFDPQGKMKEPAAYKDRIKAFLDEMLWYAGAVKTARGV